MIDSTGVVFETIWYSNTASNWTSLENFVHDSLFISRLITGSYVTIVINSISIVFLWYPTSFTVRSTVSADNIFSTHYSSIVTFSLIVGTSFVSNIIFIHPFIGIVSITTVATVVTIISIAREDDLWSNKYIRERSVSSYLNSV